MQVFQAPNTPLLRWRCFEQNRRCLGFDIFYRLKLWLYFTKSHGKPELILGDTWGDHDVKSGFFRGLWK